MSQPLTSGVLLLQVDSALQSSTERMNQLVDNVASKLFGKDVKIAALGKANTELKTAAKVCPCSYKRFCFSQVFGSPEHLAIHNHHCQWNCKHATQCR